MHLGLCHVQLLLDGLKLPPLHLEFAGIGVNEIVQLVDPLILETADRRVLRGSALRELRDKFRESEGLSGLNDLQSLKTAMTATQQGLILSPRICMATPLYHLQVPLEAACSRASVYQFGRAEWLSGAVPRPLLRNRASSLRSLSAWLSVSNLKAPNAVKRSPSGFAFPMLLFSPRSLCTSDLRIYRPEIG